MYSNQKHSSDLCYYDKKYPRIRRKRRRIPLSSITSPFVYSFRQSYRYFQLNNHEDGYDYGGENEIQVQQVLSRLDLLYAPTDLQLRTSKSRKDGYWSYIESGKEPPQYLTYGEFDFVFFSQLLEKAFHYNNDCNCTSNTNDNNDKNSNYKTFVDIGSGTGRLVVGAAALYPALKLSKGIEILPTLHESALEFLEKCNVCEGTGTASESMSDIALEESVDVSIQEDVKSEDDTGSKVNVNDDGDNKSDDQYAQPLTNQMNEMIQSLQEMTAEEWKEILGDDYDYNFEIDDDGEEEQLSDNNDEEDDDKNDTDMNMEGTSSTNEEDGDNVEKNAVEHNRLQEEEILPHFTLPSETELFQITVDPNDDDNIIEEEIENESAPSLYFESFDAFLSMSDKELMEKLEEKNFIGCERSVSSTSVNVNKNNNDSDENEEEIREDMKPSSSYYLKCSPVEVIDGARKNDDMPLSPIHFSCGSFEDPYEYIGDADVVFVFSTCWTKEMMSSLAKCIGRQCKPGTIAITTEFRMPLSGVVEAVEDDPGIPCGEYEMELVEKLDGYCGVTGGVSTAYIHRVVRSLYQEGSGPRQKPQESREELAWKIIQDYESNQLTDTDKFVTSARNSLAWMGFDSTGE